MKKKILTLTVMLLVTLITAVPVNAGPKWEYGDSSWMSLDLLGQMHYSNLDNAVEETDFYLRRFRMLVNGQIDEGIKVFLQTDYSNAGKSGVNPEFTLLDGWVDLQLAGSTHWLKAGITPLPFSMENRSAVGALLGIDYNSEVLKFVNDATWRDVGAVLQGAFSDRLGYRVGTFDGYDEGDKDPAAGLRFTGRIDLAAIGEVQTGWYTQDTLGKGTYLRGGGGYERVEKRGIAGAHFEAPVRL